MLKKLYAPLMLVLIAALLTACAGAASAKTLQQTDDSIGKVTRTINVNGTGKVYLPPDIAYITIGVHTEGKDAAAAVATNNTNSQKVKEALIDLGVEEKDIQTSNFSIYPQQNTDPQTGRPTGEITYIVDNSIMVTLRDLTKVGDILDAAVKAGANNIYGIQFDVADRAKASSDARKLAVKDAEIQAQELATAAGVTVGEVQNINSYSGSTPVYEKGYGGGAMMAAAPSVPVSPGQIAVQVDVNMIYEIK